MESYTKDDTIFVQIASYRDPELQWTLKDLFEKAKRPENIFVGICHQYDMKGDEDKHLFEIPFSHPEQLRIDEVDYREAKGLFFARSKTQQLYKNEKWTAQFDSHMRFYKNWDEIAILQLKKLIKQGYKYPLITSYPPGYNPETNEIEDNNTSLMTVKIFDKNTGIIRMTNCNYNCFEYFTNTAFISGNNFVTLAEQILKVPYDKYMYFTDEANISVRSWTNGFDFFNLENNYVAHLWNTEKLKNTKANRRVISDDNKTGYHNNSKSNARERALFNMQKSNDPEVLENIKEYGLGNKRTLRDYERFSGVDFRRKTTREHTKQGIFEDWNEVSKINDIKNIFNSIRYKYAK